MASSPASFPADIFTEPEPDPQTLKNLGPLTRLAGIWEGTGVDIHPVADGTEQEAFKERIEFQPIDAQTNGPQLLYGLRYHCRIVKVEEPIETFHDQVGYWLWEPATGTIIQTLSIPRGQTALAMGKASADAQTLELVAEEGSPVNGICSIPFLQYGFRTREYRIRVTFHADGTWSYEQDTVLLVRGREEPFHHIDRNTLKKVGEPTPNPTARASL
jgi:hypothetical protein